MPINSRKRNKRVCCDFDYIEDVFERKVSPTKTKKTSWLKGSSSRSKRQHNGHIRFSDEDAVNIDKKDSALVQLSSSVTASSDTKTIKVTGSKLVENQSNQLLPTSHEYYASVDKIKSTNIQLNKKPKKVVNALQFSKTKSSGDLEPFQDPKVTLGPTPLKDLMPGYRFCKFPEKGDPSRAVGPLRGMKVKEGFIIAKSSAHSATSQEINSSLNGTLDHGSKCIKKAVTAHESTPIGDSMLAQEPKSTLFNKSGLMGDSILSQKSKTTKVSRMAHGSAYMNGPNLSQTSKTVENFTLDKGCLMTKKSVLIHKSNPKKDVGFKNIKCTEDYKPVNKSEQTANNTLIPDAATTLDYEQPQIPLLVLDQTRPHKLIPLNSKSAHNFGVNSKDASAQSFNDCLNLGHLHQSPLSSSSSANNGVGLTVQTTNMLTKTKLSKFQMVSSASKFESRAKEIEKVVPLRGINNELSNNLDSSETFQKEHCGSSECVSSSAIDFDEGKKLEYQSDYDSDDSYISVVDSFDVKWKKPKSMKMYNEAMKLVTRGEVTCRKTRNEMRFVESEEDFLAKVHCLRQGFKVMFEDKQVFTWMAKTFRSIVVEILQLNELEPAQDAIFILTYAEIIDFFLKKKNKISVVNDLKLIGISHPTFYDVFLCYFLMDTFYDVEHPKSTLTHFGKHAQYLEQFQKFRPRRVAREIRKELSDKMKGLSNDNEFLIMMYRLNFYINPGIAMGLRGPKSLLKKAWGNFKKEAMDYIECLFSFDYVRYTKPAEMADDLLGLTNERLTRLKNETKRLGEAKRFIDQNKYSRK